jgi:uncharacterized membrane protein YraQ (UPF0718 family)
MTNKDKQITIKKAFLNALKSFLSILPMIVATIGLVGLFQAYVTSSMLSNLFGYSDSLDILIGTFIGAISSGNGAISFVVAQGLQDQGVSLYALSAFILAWVTLSFVHLFAEASVLGAKFTIYRNIMTFITTMIISFLTVITLKLFI